MRLLPMPSARPNFFSPTKKKFRQWKVEFRRRKIFFYFIKLIFRRRNSTFRWRNFFSPPKIKFRRADGMGISIGTTGFFRPHHFSAKYLNTQQELNWSMGLAEEANFGQKCSLCHVNFRNEASFESYQNLIRIWHTFYFHFRYYDYEKLWVIGRQQKKVL